MSKCIIYLIGFPGSGKFTVATELHKIFHSVIINNNLLNELIFNFTDLHNTEVPDHIWEKIFEVRSIIMQVVEKYHIKSKHYIFTNELLEDDPYDQRVYNLVVDLSRKINTTILPVILHCNRDELIRRIKMRSIHSKDKKVITDPDFAMRRIQEKKLFIPKNAFEIENSVLSAKKVTSHIIDEMQNRNLITAL